MRYVIILMILINGLLYSNDKDPTSKDSRKKVDCCKCIDESPCRESKNSFNLDFETKCLELPNGKLNEGDFYYINVCNINLNRWNIVINKTDTVISKEIDFKGLLGFTGISIPSKGNSDKNNLIGEYKDYEELKTEIIKYLFELELKYYDIINNDYKIESVDSTKQILTNMNEYRNKLLELHLKYSKSKDTAAVVAIESVINLVNSDNALKLIKNIALLNKNNCYYSLPLQFREEYSDIILEIIPKSEDFNTAAYNMKLRYPNPSQWYWTIGFSLYRSNLSTNEYTVKESKIDTISQFQIVEENSLDSEYGTAAMLKIGGIIWKEYLLGIHGTLGIGMGFSDNIKPRLLLGGGISIGKAHKFTIDGGFIGGYTRTLSNAYSLDEQMLVKPDNIYHEEFNNSVFIAIGYTFTM